MTPKRIAELRAWFPFDSSTHYDQVPSQPVHALPLAWDEMLDEIERLRGLVTAAHRFDGSQHGTRVVWPWINHDTSVPQISVRCTCSERPVALIECKDPNGSPRTDEAKAVHAEHVRQLVDGAP